VIGGLTSGNSSVLVTNGSGVPSLATDIPTAVTIGTKYIYRAEGTDVPIADGGTGASTATGAASNIGVGTEDSPTFTNATLSARTAGRVAYFGTGGLFADDADLTFDGTALSATNLIVTGATAASKAMIRRSTTQYLDLYGTSTANYITGVSAEGATKPLYIGNDQAAEQIMFLIGGTGQIQLYDGTFRPVTDSDVTLGDSSRFWSNVYADRHYLNATAYLDGANAGRIGVSGTIDAFSMTAANSLTFSAGNIVTDTTTGTKIGTGATQKLGFFNATPVIQPTGDVATALSALGLVASPTIAGGTGSFLGMYVHTSGTTHTTGATCHTIIVELIGGGGGGGGAKGSTAPAGCGAGGGGGSGSYARKTFAVAVSTDYTYAVGAAGAAGTTGPGAGGAGGNTTFAVGVTTVTAYGGSGGAAGASGSAIVPTANGAGGVVATNGDVNTTGQPGGWGLRCSDVNTVGGFGAPSMFGGGGNAVIGNGTGNAGTGYGSGGSGGGASSITAVAGGAGAAGLVIVWEFN
jgi:hypothetical protein